MYYGPVMIDLEGKELSSKERDLLQNPSVGGVLLFTRNYAGIQSLKNLVRELRSVAKNPLLIAVDHEGGRVWRFKEDFTKLPAAGYYGSIYDRDPKEALTLAYNAGWVMAAELLDCDIDLSLTPILDLNKGISQVIGDRAFHREAKVVSQLAAAFINGMNAVGMSATGKHFPGHGGCIADSHIAEAIDDRTLEKLLAEDLIPFADLSPNLAGVMPAHVIYPAIDSVPAGYSKRWLQDILREKLKFNGAIISDCLSMQAASLGGDFVLRARMALDAGCDMVILTQQDRDQLKWVLDKLERKNSPASVQRLQTLAGKFQNETRKTKRPEIAFE